MTHFFDKKDRWGHGLALWVLAGMVFTIPLIVLAFRGLHLENDIENWLPENDPQAIALDWYQHQFDVEESVFVTWTGSSFDDPRIKLFEHELEPIHDEEGIARRGSPFIESVATPRETLQRMMKQKIDQQEAVRRLTGTLIGRGPLRIRFTEVGLRRKSQTVNELKALARQELGLELFVSDPFVTAEIEFNDAQMARLDEIETAAQSVQDPDESFEVQEMEFPKHDLTVSWRGIDHQPEQVDQFSALVKGMHSPTSPNLPQGEPLVEDCFFAPGSPVAVMLTLSEAGIADKKATLQSIKNAAYKSGVSEDDLRLGGRIVASLALNEEVGKAAWDRSHPVWNLYRRSPMLLSGPSRWCWLSLCFAASD